MYRFRKNLNALDVPTQARRRMAAGLAFLAAAIAFPHASAQQSPPKPPEAQVAAPATPAKPPDYVGSETCQGCHEDIFTAFQKNPHHLVETDKKYHSDTKACESCHGPGSKHAESMTATDIRNPAKLKPADTDKVCLACHLNQPTHVGRITAGHARNSVSCVSCHSIHKNGPDGLKPHTSADTNKLCASCHNSVWASFQRPYKHPLPQGAMSCVDCHNPHGTQLARSLQTVNANEPGCFKCHGDLRGPFTYEHAPVRMEGCATCHQPHGSANPRMLTRAQVRYVCLECHSNLPVPNPPANAALGTVPPALHNFTQPRFQNCNLCHQKIHGSYVDRDFFK